MVWELKKLDIRLLWRRYGVYAYGDTEILYYENLQCMNVWHGSKGLALRFEVLFTAREGQSNGPIRTFYGEKHITRLAGMPGRV